MAVISIIGCPGIGKSFLAKYLACKNCLPGFFEGEAGIFSDEVLAVLNGEEDSEQRYEWLFGRYKKTLERAHKISEQGIDCYVDGDVLTAEAWLNAEIGDKSPKILKRWLEDNKHLMAHKVIILYSDEDKVVKTIQGRGREAEQSDFIIQRALRIQREAIKLAKKYPHTILVDRTNLDFTDPKTLKELEEKIRRLEPRR
jgi:deoxyadenosine/deoxycytidine kinase